MKEFILILPEVFLALTLTFVVIGEISHFGEQVRLITATAITGLAGALIQTIISYQYGSTQIFAHTVSLDGLSLFFKMLFISLAALAIVASTMTREIPEERRSEYSALILAASLAMCLCASATDLLLIFLSLQFVNILGYFLAGYGKTSVHSTEAAIKYMAFATVSGFLLLYGFAILFAHTHTLNLYEAQKFLISSPMSKETTLIVFMLIFIGLTFQIATFPMYLWVPDVLEGAPTATSAFLSVGSRACGFAVGIRMILVVFAKPLEGGRWQVLGSAPWPEIIAIVAGVSILLGSLMAYRQVAAKRLVACLVIAETGSLLLGILVMDEVGVAALLFNLVVDLFALMGIYYVLSLLVDELKSDRLQDFKGVLSRAVPECICLVLFLWCFIGLPPFPGFIGKFTLIGAAVRHRWLVLALVSVVGMAISTIAVAKLAFSLIGDFRKPSEMIFESTFERKAFLSLLVFPMVLIGIFAEFVLSWAGKSLGFILW